ncbi:MAG TPA: D-Ala-D-Ala carboxypeptidase family metallohydrolase [Xanthomonadales bacterium]|nr:D-Ala-D-Ala carboxypeptidase family metallohydrolase [Xanthomonadales bacterium]
MITFRARLITILTALVLSSSALGWNDDRLSVPVMVNGHIIPYPEFAIFVMPGTPISAGFVDSGGGASVRWANQVMNHSSRQLVAPDNPGLEVLEITDHATGESCVISVFTMVPAANVGKNGRLNGYRIGRYPDEPLRGLDIYLPPNGFVEVTSKNRHTKVSPNFTLGEFVSKQESGYPKYVVLRSSLLLKLENILATLNLQGYPTDGFVIMSGYRTPFYNRAIGNVQYSRHVWGGAADVFINNSPIDGKMDDLNKDGKVNRADARWLADFIENMYEQGSFGPRVGGVGVYGSNSAHGPFVHIDVRGTRARW